MPQRSATKPVGSPFIELQSVDSTNNYARRLIHAACLPDRQGLSQHGMVIFAHEQVAGKGQRGKVWATEKGANIIISLVVKPQPLQLAQQFQLSACVAVAVQEFFMKYAGDDTKIKWPNDLYWQDRKAGGILIENIVGSRSEGLRTPSEESGVEGLPSAKDLPGAMREWISIVGIGININQVRFHPEIKNPVSLKQITGKTFNPVELAKELCSVFDKRFTELKNEGFENIYKLYLAHLYKRKATVKLKKGSKIFEALIEGVSPTGKLITQHAIREEFDFGAVEWVI